MRNRPAAPSAAAGKTHRVPPALYATTAGPAARGPMSNLTSCKVTTDCSSVYHTCSSDGVCGCSHSTGATGEKCLYTSSGDATVYFALICFYASVWLGFLVYHTHCTFVVFRSGKRGAMLKFTILLEIGVAGEVVREGCRMVSLSSPDSFGPGALHTFEKVDLTTLTFAATGALSGAMVMGLIWVEFVLASQRMANVGNDLKLTAKILQVTTGSYLVLSVMLTVWHASLTPNTVVQIRTLPRRLMLLRLHLARATPHLFRSST